MADKKFYINRHTLPTWHTMYTEYQEPGNYDDIYSSEYNIPSENISGSDYIYSSNVNPFRYNVFDADTGMASWMKFDTATKYGPQEYYPIYKGSVPSYRKLIKEITPSDGIVEFVRKSDGLYFNGNKYGANNFTNGIVPKSLVFEIQGGGGGGAGASCYWPMYGGSGGGAGGFCSVVFTPEDNVSYYLVAGSGGEGGTRQSGSSYPSAAQIEAAKGNQGGHSGIWKNSNIHDLSEKSLKVASGGGWGGIACNGKDTPGKSPSYYTGSGIVTGDTHNISILVSFGGKPGGDGDVESNDFQYNDDYATYDDRSHSRYQIYPTYGEDYPSHYDFPIRYTYLLWPHVEWPSSGYPYYGQQSSYWHKEYPSETRKNGNYDISGHSHAGGGGAPSLFANGGRGQLTNSSDYPPQSGSQGSGGGSTCYHFNGANGGNGFIKIYY